MQNKSPLFRLNWRDLIQGTLVMMITAFITTFYDAFNQYGFDINIVEFKEVLKVTILAGIAYLIKNIVQGQRKTRKAKKIYYTRKFIKKQP
jgi:dihydrodipicolinate reductase